MSCVSGAPSSIASSELSRKSLSIQCGRYAEPLKSLDEKPAAVRGALDAHLEQCNGLVRVRNAERNGFPIYTPRKVLSDNW